jgi:hypothetical protein
VIDTLSDVITSCLDNSCDLIYFKNNWGGEGGGWGGRGGREMGEEEERRGGGTYSSFSANINYVHFLKEWKVKPEAWIFHCCQL